MMPITYKLGDLVWAKMKNFPPWPGRIANPTAKLKKGSKLKRIFFFGTNNYAYIKETNIKPYFQYKKELMNASKSSGFKVAVAQIEEYIKNKAIYPTVDQNDTDAEFNRLKATTPPPLKKSKDKKPKKETTGTKRAGDLIKATVPKKNCNAMSCDSIPISTKHVIIETRKISELFSQQSTSTNLAKAETSSLDLETVSDILNKKKVIFTSRLKFGFLGLGAMGSGIVKNLIKSGHTVIIWNRTLSKCETFKTVGAKVMQTPCDVVLAADITFSCVSDPNACKDMVFGNCGVLQAGSMFQSKGYVEITGIDAETSQDIADAIKSNGGRYLEAQLQGSKLEAEEGTLIILAAGDRTLFDECYSCFTAMGKHSFYFGDVGNAIKMNLVLQLINGIVIAGIAEGMALADRAGIQVKDVLEVLKLTTLACPTVLEKSSLITASFTAQQPLMHMQKDLRLSLEMADNLQQSSPLTATANEIFKRSKRLSMNKSSFDAKNVDTLDLDVISSSDY